jgi:DHA1 family bicyclomycin/chloramphenicol resistance-like MFS transporter
VRERSRRSVWTLVVLGGLSAFGPLSIDMYLPALPRLAAALDASASLIQVTLTGFLLGLAAGQLLAGPLSDRLGRRRPQLARVFARLMLVTGLAPIVAPLVGAGVLRATSWRGVFVVLAAIGAILLAAAATLPETLPPERRRDAGLAPVGRAVRTLGRDRRFVGYTAAVACSYAAMFVYIAGSPFVLEDLHHLSAQSYAGVFAVNALGLVVAGQVGAALVRQVGPRALLAAGLSAQAAGAAALVVAVAAGLGVRGIVVSLFTLVAAVGLVLPNASALALADHPDIAGSAAGLLGVFQFAVGALVAPLAGAGGGRSAWPTAVAIAVLTLAALAALRTTRARPTG